MPTTTTEPQSALLLKSEWCHKILHCGKDLELRGTPCHSKVGKTVALGTGGLLLGEVTISSCFLLAHVRDGRLEDHSPYSFNACAPRHHVYDLSVVQYKNVWAWELNNPVVYSVPKPYFHPQGAIVWIDLTKQQDGKPLVKREPEKRIRRQVTVMKNLKRPSTRVSVNRKN